MIGIDQDRVKTATLTKVTDGINRLPSMRIRTNEIQGLVLRCEVLIVPLFPPGIAAAIAPIGQVDADYRRVRHRKSAKKKKRAATRCPDLEHTPRLQFGDFLDKT